MSLALTRANIHSNSFSVFSTTLLLLLSLDNLRRCLVILARRDAFRGCSKAVFTAWLCFFANLMAVSGGILAISRKIAPDAISCSQYASYEGIVCFIGVPCMAIFMGFKTWYVLNRSRWYLLFNGASVLAHVLVGVWMLNSIAVSESTLACAAVTTVDWTLVNLAVFFAVNVGTNGIFGYVLWLNVRIHNHSKLRDIMIRQGFVFPSIALFVNLLDAMLVILVAPNWGSTIRAVDYVISCTLAVRLLWYVENERPTAMFAAEEEDV